LNNSIKTKSNLNVNSHNNISIKKDKRSATSDLLNRKNVVKRDKSSDYINNLTKSKVSNYKPITTIKDPVYNYDYIRNLIEKANKMGMKPTHVSDFKKEKENLSSK